MSIWFLLTGWNVLWTNRWSKTLLPVRLSPITTIVHLASLAIFLIFVILTLFFRALNTSHFRFGGLQKGFCAVWPSGNDWNLRHTAHQEQQCSTALLLLRLAPKRPLEDDTREKREWKKWGWNIHIVSSSENKTTLHNTNDENTLAMQKSGKIH